MSFALALACGVVAAASGHVLLRRYFVGRSRGVLALAIAAFFAGQLGYYVALQGLDVGVVYMANGLIPVLALALARWLLGEPTTSHHVRAVALIVLGVVIYNL